MLLKTSSAAIPLAQKRRELAASVWTKDRKN